MIRTIAVGGSRIFFVVLILCEIMDFFSFKFEKVVKGCFALSFLSTMIFDEAVSLTIALPRSGNERFATLLDRRRMSTRL